MDFHLHIITLLSLLWEIRFCMAWIYIAGVKNNQRAFNYCYTPNFVILWLVIFGIWVQQTRWCMALRISGYFLVVTHHLLKSSRQDKAYAIYTPILFDFNIMLTESLCSLARISMNNWDVEIKQRCIPFCTYVRKVPTQYLTLFLYW